MKSFTHIHCFQVLGPKSQNKSRKITIRLVIKTRVEIQRILRALMMMKMLIQILMARIRKVHSKEKLENEDYQLLKVPQKLPKTHLTSKENLFALTNPQPEFQKRMGQKSSFRTKYTTKTIFDYKLFLHQFSGTQPQGVMLRRKNKENL